MEKRAKILGIILIILIIAFVVTMIILNKKDPEVEHKILVNEQLNTSQIVKILKTGVLRLTSSDDLEISAITDEDMVEFAISYMQATNQDGISMNIDKMELSAKVEGIEQVTKDIFEREINWDNVSYTVKDGYVTTYIYIGSTDLQIFKLRQKEYDEVSGYYTVYIDSLEPISGNQTSELKEVTTTSYPEENIIYTLILRYKEADGSKVLLSYKKINNI